MGLQTLLTSLTDDSLPSDSPVPSYPAVDYTVDGVSINVRSTEPGRERTAVMVHGLGGSSLNWTDLMFLLSSQVQSFALDLPGFGTSDVPAGWNFSLTETTSLVISFIEQLNLGPVDLFGNSMGGTISVRVASLRPDLVSSIILVSPALPDFKPRMSMSKNMRVALLQSSTQRLFPVSVEKTVNNLLNICYHDASCVPSSRRAEEIAQTKRLIDAGFYSVALRKSAHSLATSFFPYSSTFTWSLAQKVSTPGLIIFGTYDQLVSSRLAKRSQVTFKNCDVIVLPTGHVAQLEMPVTVAKLVTQTWLKHDI